MHIPNLEVSESFEFAIEDTNWNEIAKALRKSDDLLEATIHKKADIVAAALDDIHSAETSVLKYNDENSLSCALTIAYYTARRDYMIVREFPTGKGFADLTFIPRKGTDKPAMIIELKYDKDADSAIRQIKEKEYSGKLKDYSGKMLLVGINYDKETKKHTCIIE